jgi:hypothetical protein
MQGVSWLHLPPIRLSLGTTKMKKQLPMKTSFGFALLMMIAVSATAQNSSLITTFKFAGITEGYDHVCKTQVWVNGALAGESNEVKESVGATFTVEVPAGDQQIRVVNLANYEGNWEEHTIDNNYSIDCLWEGTATFGKKPSKLFLLFDLDGTTLASWKKMPKTPK